MFLSPTELERLTIFNAAELARRHRELSIKLSHPEACALISDQILLEARKGEKSAAEVVSMGSTILSTDDVLPGVTEMIPFLMIDALFPDGVKLITIYNPIRPGTEPLSEEPIPGEVITPDQQIELNADKIKISLSVLNTGDRPVQIGSHFHFFEVNKALEFDRAQAFGRRLDVPSGTAVRFEPGQNKHVDLINIGGMRRVSGFNNLSNGWVDDPEIKDRAIATARQRGFKGA